VDVRPRPRLRVGGFSSYNGVTFSKNWEMDPEDFKTLLPETSADARSGFPDRFHRYFIKGGGHCVLDYSYSVGGVSIWEWIGYLLGDDPLCADVLE
jgi:hypothetical protein